MSIDNITSSDPLCDELQLKQTNQQGDVGRQCRRMFTHSSALARDVCRIQPGDGRSLSNFAERMISEIDHSLSTSNIAFASFQQNHEVRVKQSQHQINCVRNYQPRPLHLTSDLSFEPSPNPFQFPLQALAPITLAPPPTPSRSSSYESTPEIINLRLTFRRSDLLSNPAQSTNNPPSTPANPHRRSSSVPNPNLPPNDPNQSDPIFIDILRNIGRQKLCECMVTAHVFAIVINGANDCVARALEAPVSYVVKISRDVYSSNPTIQRVYRSSREFTKRIAKPVIRITGETLDRAGITRLVNRISSRFRELGDDCASFLHKEFAIPEEMTRQFYQDTRTIALFATSFIPATRLQVLIKPIAKVSRSLSEPVRRIPTVLLTRRINYSARYYESLENFARHIEHIGPFSKDFFMVQVHSQRSVLHALLGKKQPSYMWFMPLSEALKSRSMQHMMDRLGLLSSWGGRTHFTLIKVPAGREVRFLSGTASRQIDHLALEFRPGGGIQYRFFEFDKSWIVATRALPRNRERPFTANDFIDMLVKYEKAFKE